MESSQTPPSTPLLRRHKLSANNPRHQSPSRHHLRLLSTVAFACASVTTFIVYMRIHSAAPFPTSFSDLPVGLLPTDAADSQTSLRVEEHKEEVEQQVVSELQNQTHATSNEELKQAKQKVPELQNQTSATPSHDLVKPNSPELQNQKSTTTEKSHQQSYPQSTSPFAYAFVIGGCSPDYQPSYQNYMFNILVSAYILKERGSKADVVALFQVSSKAKRTRLPDKDTRLLHALGVYVYYIPQQTTGKESFYRTQLDKFRILGLTQYERILFMDGDVMPLANLDYLFEFSMNGTLQENIVIQGIYEPANGGFFMLRPGTLQQLNDIVQWRERTALELPYPFFDVIKGWGHALTADDPWQALKAAGTNYTFLAAFADQGLLFHYTKYARKCVSIILRDGSVENWGPVPEKVPNGTTSTLVRKVAVLNNPFANAREASNRIQLPGRHNKFGIPLESIVHFTGNKKPWLGGPPQNRSNATQFKSEKDYWFWKLTELDEKLGIGLDFDTHWKSGKQRPPLGMYPVYGHVLNASSNLLTPVEREYPRSPQDYRIL